MFCFSFPDGKFHVLPSGDLHILRADEGDAGVPYSCLVVNTLTGLEESSPPFHLAIDSKCRVPWDVFGKSSVSVADINCNCFLFCRHRIADEAEGANAPRPLLLLRKG